MCIARVRYIGMREIITSPIIRYIYPVICVGVATWINVETFFCLIHLNATPDETTRIIPCPGQWACYG